MKHVKQITKQCPRQAQINVGVIFTAVSQILQVVGGLLIEKQEWTRDPYDY